MTNGLKPGNTTLPTPWRGCSSKPTRGAGSPALDTKQKGWEAQRAQAEKEIQRLKKDKAGLKSQKTSADKEIQQLKKDKAELESQNTSANNEIQQLRNDKAKLESQRASLQGELRSVRRDIDLHRQEHNRYVSQAAALFRSATARLQSTLFRVRRSGLANESSEYGYYNGERITTCVLYDDDSPSRIIEELDCLVRDVQADEARLQRLDNPCG